MNDVLDPTKFRETGTVAPDNVINLKTPEQEAAAKRAAAERAARVAAQKNNPPENLVDGVKPVVENSMGNASAPGIKPVMPTPVVEANPSPMSSTTTPTTEATPQGGVFKLNEPTIQEEQQSTTNLTTEQPQQVEKKLGFFKRLFGGGKKKEPQPTDSPATEQPNPPEQQQ